MADYDAPRNPVPPGEVDDTVTELRNRRTERRFGATDIGEPDAAASSYFAALDVIDDAGEPTMAVQAQQHDEFTCTRCFLVQHRRRLVSSRGRQQFCLDCG